MGLPTLIYSFLIYFFLLLLPGEPALLVLSACPERSRREAEGPTLTLALVGDVMLGRGVAQALDGDWEAAFAEVRPWLDVAELTFANLESPLTTAPQVSDGYDLRAPPEAAAALRAAGFDVVSLANNHALDAGEAGLAETVATLNAMGIAGLVNWETGALGNWETGKLVDWSPPYSFAHYSSTHLPIYYFLACDDSAVPLDLESVAETVTAAAEQADLVIVSIHWGGEYQAAPGPRQRAVARTLADAGAGFIVGHGPHVLQRVEWVGETLVAYSLGNFLFDQPYPADCRQGAILRLTLQGDRFVAVEAIPTVVERNRVVPAGPEDSAAILARLAQGWYIGKLVDWETGRPVVGLYNQCTNLPIYQFTNSQEHKP